MTHRPKRNKPRPLVIPQMIQGFDVIDSVRTAVAGIRAIYEGTAATISRQHFTDLNMVWQQTTKVHEVTQRREPPRREILAAHNIMTRLNNNADVTRAEFEQVVDVLQRVLAAVRAVRLGHRASRSRHLAKPTTKTPQARNFHDG